MFVCVLLVPEDRAQYVNRRAQAVYLGTYFYGVVLAIVVLTCCRKRRVYDFTRSILRAAVSSPGAAQPECSGRCGPCTGRRVWDCPARGGLGGGRARDRKSTRLNSSHVSISYAVFCLKKKKQ